uniref:hypothetical protein n=1 Tax=Fulvivirga sp. TaxID=1931237 RepID=UPI00404B74C3
MKKLTLSIAYILFFALSLNAQPGGGDPNGGGKPGDVPIGGIELLLLAGGAFGARRLMRKK